MWPLYLLLNKFLKAEDVNVRCSDDPSSLVESHLFRQLSSEKCHAVTLPHSHFVEVPHINQQRSWDCGLACVLMVLKTIGIDSCDLETLGELCCTTSIWTVDLAYLLQKFSLNFSYFTVTIGANPNFSMETFYKDQLPNDLVRVDKLFQKALEAGINIQCRSINGEEISLLILSGKYIAIALVDQYKLSRSWLENVCVSDIYGGNSGYTGHYVVICGYDAHTDEFEIRDPASSRNHERVLSKCLEKARKSFDIFGEDGESKQGSSMNLFTPLCLY
ncbi:guanylyl cyclase 1 isoform X3 [Malania oleifera]|uniref:guanylyl cyclase 1 isoform X3 n=1 Tax=Malania oleifera TaxID=397392 RepID=UPI0025AE5E11|nr:guanylyl cyclase 1 isoform X3 [Malania oleifera]